MSDRKEEGLSRRDLMRGSLAAAVLSTGLRGTEAKAGSDGTYPNGASPEAREFDFTASSAALQPDKVVESACQFCNCNCRLKVHLKAGRVIDITGEEKDPVQAGGLCVKAPMMAQLVYNRGRLTRPLKRVGGE